MGKNKTPISIVIFGITGDLARSKLIPALFELHTKGRLESDFNIIGFGRKSLSAEEFSSLISEALIIKKPGTEIKLLRGRHKFIQRCSYVQGELTEKAGYDRLRQSVMKRRVIYLLSVHPELHEVIISKLGKEGLLNSKSQVLIEKPFGHDEKSALTLDKKIRKYVKEDQICRIDHYLGKAALRDLLRYRRTKKKFEAALGKGVKAINVCLFEKKGISRRGAFYDNVGALKDVGQNHLLQMLAAVIASKDIASGKAHKVQKARAAALNSLSLKTPAVRAQYLSYHDEPGVAPHSGTETFFSIAATSSISKFKNTTMTLSAGKALSEDRSEIRIIFYGPKQGTSFEVIFSLNNYFGPKEKPMEAYERIFLAAIENDRSLFCSLDEVIAGWKFDRKVRQFWKKHSVPLKKYAIGEPIHISEIH